MRLPFLGEISKQRKTIGSFGGINQSSVIAENEFSSMLNMSSDLYPAIGPRPSRGEKITELVKVNGLHHNNALVWVDGTDFYYEGNKVGTVTDSEKNMVSMGAYIVIFPDKKVYNTHSGEWQEMEQTWSQGDKATFTPTVDASTFIKIDCTNIGAFFKKGDGVEISGCTNVGFNKSVVLQSVEKDSIVVIGDLKEAFTQGSGLVLKRKVPDMDYVTESENRLWGCNSEKHEVYASKLGDPTNWNCFEGISTDSYAATVGSEGDFTGIATHLGYVLFFKEQMIHKVYGNKPSNIQINSYQARGVKNGCSKSICVVNETLFYASGEGICAYDGSMPYLVSQNIKKDYTEAVAGQERGKYYVSLLTKDGWEVYVYDTSYRIWHKEDGSHFKATCYAEGKMYYIDSKNALQTVTGDEEAETVIWSVESGDQEEGTLDKKKLHRMQLLMELESGSVVELFLKYENEPVWKRITTFTAPKKHAFHLNLRPRRSSHYRWKLIGRGKVKLFGIAKEYEIGSGR